jgi:hypothetical protein
MATSKRTPEDRFWAKVNKTDGCWLWTAALSRDGYGMFDRCRAHRVAWSIANGEIPGGLYVLHICDNRRCVRPDHLYTGTARQNSADAVSRRRLKNQQKTHCPKGHPYTLENTIVAHSGRKCRACVRRQDARRLRERRIKRIAEGVCVRCGGALGPSSDKHCGDCLSAAKGFMAKQRMKVL